MRTIGHCLGCGLVAWLAGCSTGHPPARKTTVLRFIHEDPPPIAGRDQLYRGRRVFRSAFETGEEPIVGPPHLATTKFELGGEPVTVSWDMDRTHLVFPAPFDPTAMDRLEVLLAVTEESSDRIGDVALYWTKGSESFSQDRMVVVPEGMVVEQTARSGPRLRFFLADRPSWREADRLRLTVVWPGNSPVWAMRLVEVAGFAEELDLEALDPFVDDGFKITLDGQTANALPGVIGRSLVRRLVVPNEAELRFACGLMPPFKSEVRFSVTVQPDDGSAPAAQEIVLRPDARGWHHHAVDLGQWSGKTVRLILETTWEADDVIRGFALWGHPEVIASP